ncbi:DNA-3-methyladenine glycosylase family protein [Pseudomonas sp. CJQ_7]|uniref:DNA-3-methyladenine glycosylase II n=2 Tax=Pseudomonas putida group TaxID=136845 RepID=A0A2N1IT34_9PSED|nr:MULTISPECIES: DNA-3-methyladenine glycosylase [Pseudomonas]EKT4458303.1 DNA-3-methyladenine glycosylase 2 family protein [Pseudomonas putida]EKT4473599.1 DNA-3-methyladenine glycosylase 2 family protein [Pseudomonas putida]EKT4495141.1 DNA-3-methyladenine glycosylase 2 family protein [Pseudomonas putida]EKT4514251.1 DNA-3-methyladenine glycosylase 2 family protein [Pseudomonas putida]EKT4531713.1 DNA-3-methyladenine glycosylase 2 family protein [Pseudomonas putida]
MMLADLSPEAYREATQHLAALDPDWSRHIAAIGPCLHQATPGREPYEALVRAIAYQQLHARAAEAILGRLLALFPADDFPQPEQLLAVTPETLRACGFSASKLETVQGIAQATLEGLVPTREQALTMSDEALIERLVALRGVGRWTVEMLLIYSLGRSDILPVDDFGVREGYRRLKGLEKAPTPAQMRSLGGAWRPFRTVAAWYLWRA